METFTVTHYAPDGELFGSSALKYSELSTKWLRICTDLIDSYGPIFDQSMGSTLSHYRIKCTAGLCHFSVNGHIVFIGAMLPPSVEPQNIDLLQTLSSQVGRTFSVSPSRPHFLVVDLLEVRVPEGDRHAMFQLSYHLAAAYLLWRGT